MTLTYAVDQNGQQLLDGNGRPIVSKQYSNATKLFRIGEHPIGAMTWGVGNLGERTAESLVLEFGLSPGAQTAGTVQAMADGLLIFVRPYYTKQFGSLAVNQQPVMGFMVGGYSTNSSEPETWEFTLPQSANAMAAAPTGWFGCSWRGVDQPLNRLIFGYDDLIPSALQAAGVQPQVVANLFNRQTWTLPIYFPSMPLQDAINFTEFALRTTIGAAEFQLGAPSCGGPLQVAVVIEARKFLWVAEPQLRLRGGG